MKMIWVPRLLRCGGKQKGSHVTEILGAQLLVDPLLVMFLLPDGLSQCGSVEMFEAGQPNKIYLKKPIVYVNKHEKLTMTN